MSQLLNRWLTGQRWGCSLVGPVFTILALVWTTQTLAFLHHAQSTTGTVVKLASYANNDNTIEYATIFQFSSADGATHIVESAIRSNPPGFRIGEQVTVLYRTDQPASARISTFMQLWFLPMIFGIMGILTTLFAAWLWLQHKRKSPRWYLVAQPKS